MARRRRRRIEFVKDKARRDPVWAEKIARRHVAFRDVPKSTSTPVMTTSTSPTPPSILTACAVRSGNLAARLPTTCSTQCLNCAVTLSAPAHASTTPLASSKVTVNILPKPAAATSSPMSKLDVSGALAFELGLFTVSPTTSSAVSLDPVPVAAAAVLTQANSSGSAALVSMSVQLGAPEGADNAAKDEDEQMLAGSSVEWPLTLVTAMDVVDGHNFVTDTGAMPLTLAALSVDYGHVVNMYEVLLPLHLLLPLSKRQESYLSPLVPQCTQAMVTWGASLNLLHARYSGMSSDLGSASAATHLISLLPWDPGGKQVYREFLSVAEIVLGVHVLSNWTHIYQAVVIIIRRN